jgi:hypothetical protein
VECGRTWTVRPKKRGRRGHRMQTSILSRVLVDGFTLRQLFSQRSGVALPAYRYRFRQALHRFVVRPAPQKIPQEPLVLLADGLWFEFDEPGLRPTLGNGPHSSAAARDLQQPYLQQKNLTLPQFVTSNIGRGGRRHLPKVFTEHGALMAATILNSPRAIEVSVYVVRAFVQLRDLLAGNRSCRNA